MGRVPPSRPSVGQCVSSWDWKSNIVNFIVPIVCVDTRLHWCWLLLRLVWAKNNGRNQLCIYLHGSGMGTLHVAKYLQTLSCKNHTRHRNSNLAWQPTNQRLRPQVNSWQSCCLLTVRLCPRWNVCHGCPFQPDEEHGAYDFIPHCICFAACLRYSHHFTHCWAHVEQAWSQTRLNRD